MDFSVRYLECFDLSLGCHILLFEKKIEYIIFQLLLNNPHVNKKKLCEIRL